jgi:hypothetical protein
MKYTVDVIRVVKYRKSIVVEATDKREAETKALKKAKGMPVFSDWVDCEVHENG